MPSIADRLGNRLDRAGAVSPAERAAVVWSFLYFFCLLASYFILRPLRDEMGVAAGRDILQFLFTATFIVMLLAAPVYAAIWSRLPRRRFIPLGLSFLRFQSRDLLAAAVSGLRAPMGRALFFRLGQRLQPVRRVGVLVVHGRYFSHRSGQAPVWVYRGRGNGRHLARIVDHGGADTVYRCSEPARGRCGASGDCSFLRWPAGASRWQLQVSTI